MTPQQTADYLTAHVQKMEKKASALQKAATHLKKAEGCHEKMGKCLDKMGTGIDTLTDHVEGMKEHMGGKSAEAGELQKALSKSVDEATAGIKSIHEDMVSAHEEMADEHELISGSLEEAADEAAEATAAGIAASEKGGEKMAGGYAMRKMQRQHDRERVEDRREFAKTLKASQTAILGQFKEFTNGFTNAFAKAAETGDIAKRAEPARMALVSGDKSADGTGLVKNVQTDPTLSTPGSGAAPTGGIKPTLADGRTPNPEFLKLDESQRQDILEKNLATARPMEGMKGMMALQDIQTVKSQTA